MSPPSTMSSRRPTRAASVATSAGVAPATPGRRSSRRLQNTPLPAVAGNSSTAYGSNTLAAPIPMASVSGIAIANLIDDRLAPEAAQSHVDADDSMSPAASSRASRRNGRAAEAASKVSSLQPTHRRGGNSRARNATPTVSEKSYINESGIFQNAAMETSSVSESELSGIPEEEAQPYPPSYANHNPIPRQHDETLEELANQRLDAAQTNPTPNSLSFTSRVTRMKETMQPSGDFFGRYGASSSLCCKALLLSLIATLVVVAACWFAGSSAAGLDLRDINHALPRAITHPLEFLESSEVRDFNRRLEELEYDVHRLMKQSKAASFDPKAIQRLQALLPDYVVFEKDAFGNPTIPDRLWRAVQQKIRGDETLLRIYPAGGELLSVSDDRTVGHINTFVTLQFSRLWEQYLDSNAKKLQGSYRKHIDSIADIPKSLAAMNVATKDDVVDILRELYDEDDVKAELTKVTKSLNGALQELAHLRDKSITMAEARAIAAETVQTLIPQAQVEALINSRVKVAAAYAMTRLDHFSIDAGAVIDSQLTSHPYETPQMKSVSLPMRLLLSAMGNPVPSPRPAAEALTSWEHYGQCWCAESNVESDSGPQLAVIVPASVYADEIVIEHVLPSASRKPYAAPKEMELWAWFDDMDIWNTVREASNDIFGGKPNPSTIPLGYVKVAEMTFDTAEPMQTAQVFDVAVDMKGLNAHSDRWVVRVVDNWEDGMDHTCLYRVRLHGEQYSRIGA